MAAKLRVHGSTSIMRRDSRNTTLASAVLCCFFQKHNIRSYMSSYQISKPLACQSEWSPGSGPSLTGAPWGLYPVRLGLHITAYTCYWLCVPGSRDNA